VRHEEAWTRLPDLLDDRDDSALLAHVRVCEDCQRQLFLLGRVDRLLRDEAADTDRPRGKNWPRVLHLVAAVAVVAAAASLVVLLLPQHGRSQTYVLRTASGHSVAQAQMAHSDARNASLAFKAHGLPVGRDHMFVLWASNNTSSMEVGRFMVDQTGGCSVRFNLPTNHAWNHFWVTRPGNTAAVVAST
jgi:hypothetical protein